MKNKLLLFCFILFNLSVASSQTPPPSQNFAEHPRAYTQRRSFWFEANIGGIIHKNDSGKIKWQYQLDWQYRRSGDANYLEGGNMYNIFKQMQQHVFRPWIHYWPQPGKVRLSASPIGHWGTWTPEEFGPQLYFSEYRSTYQVTLFQKFGKLDIQQRYRYEFRWIGKKDTALQNAADLISPGEYPDLGRRMRLRYMLRANYPLNKSGRSYVSLWDELFIGLGRHVGNNKMFDQNRLVALFGRKLSGSNPIKIELGLMWQIAPRYDMTVPPTQSYSYQNNNVESNLAFQVYLIFDEFDKLFKKKKK